MIVDFGLVMGFWVAVATLQKSTINNRQSVSRE
jgi:hypothetical protein